MKLYPDPRLPIPPRDTYQQQLNTRLYELFRSMIHMLNVARDGSDDVIVDQDDKGVVLQSPDGHFWRITVNNSGVLSTADLGTTKP